MKLKFYEFVFSVLRQRDFNYNCKATVMIIMSALLYCSKDLETFIKRQH